MQQSPVLKIIILILFLIALGLAFWAGWKKGQEKVSSTVSTTTTIATDVSATTSPESSSEQSSGKIILPTGFPTDVPLYPNAKTTSSNQTPEGTYTLALETTDTSEQVSSYYKTELPQAGWATEEPETVAGVILFSGKKNNRTISLQIIPRQGQVAIALIVSP